jgi:hypothetical protein
MYNTTENRCIFFLDNDPRRAAQALFDTDLKLTILYLAMVASKAIKEMAQGVDWQKEGYTIYNTDSEPPFDSDVRWLESTPSIWKWSADYFRAMLAEYEYRFESKHPSHDIVRLFDSDAELDGSQVDEFTSPPIGSIDSKYHVDANFRTSKVFNEKGKGKFKISVLNTNRNLYKIKYNDDKTDSSYTKREAPVFIVQPQSEEVPRTWPGRPAWAPPRRN